MSLFVPSCSLDRLYYNQVLSSPKFTVPYLCKCFGLCESQSLSHPRPPTDYVLRSLKYPAPIASKHFSTKSWTTKKKLPTWEWVLSETQLVFHGKINSLSYRRVGPIIAGQELTSPQKHRRFVFRSMKISCKLWGYILDKLLRNEKHFLFWRICSLYLIEY